MPSFGNTDIIKKELEFKEKVERQIWQCIPDRRLYRRDVVISKLEIEANAKRFEKYEAPVMPIDNKVAASNAKRAGRGGAPGIMDKHTSSMKEVSKTTSKNVDFIGNKLP